MIGTKNSIKSDHVSLNTMANASLTALFLFITSTPPLENLLSSNVMYRKILCIMRKYQIIDQKD